MLRYRKTLRRIHVWIGWLVGVPLLLWTFSGFVMILKPIEEVRGEHLLAPAEPVRLSEPLVPPRIPEGLALDGLSLEQRASGPAWVIRLADGTVRTADPATGALQAPPGIAGAVSEVEARYRGDARIDHVRRVSGEDPPLDWRRPVDAFQVEMEDGTRFYVEQGSGRIAATRTDWWRVFDFFWGLHIMDLQTREE